MNAASFTGQFRKPTDLPPLRASLFEPDEYDAQRVAWNKSLWSGQDDLLRQRDRSVEENIRMLHGQQWIVWSNLRGRYVNLAEHLTDDERRWRHMPVLNRLMIWFVLTHARMTENPPVISWNAGPDRIDELLAEVCDPIYKYIWRDVGMLEVLDRLMSWMIPSGRAFLISRIDPTRGDLIQSRGPATLSLVDASGQTIQRSFDDVPFARNAKTGDFSPTQGLAYDESLDDYVPKDLPGMAPEMFYEGGIDVDVRTCLEVRGEWGQHVPWHRKAWHETKTLLTPMQAWETWGVELEPDVTGQDAESTGVLWRMLHGGGLFGAADGRRGTNTAAQEEFCTIYESWHRPSRFPGTQRTSASAGGRCLVTTGGGKVIRDGVRPAPFKYGSPIRAFDFVGLPGRSQGTSPQEFMNGPIRTRNRLHGQQLAHATLSSNPIRVVDRAQGIEAGQVSNIPGSEIVADRSKSKAMPVEYVPVPAMGRDVMDAADRLRSEIDELGSISGSEGAPPTEDPSGELVKELRFNSDRTVSSTLRRTVIELGRLGEDWMVMLPIIWDRQRTLKVAGDDNIARTITVYPELFEQGSVHVEPEIESMLPEGRGERQARAWNFWQKGVWGDPLSVEARNQFLDQSRFPHMARMTRPGGADRATAEQNVGRILQGVPAAKIDIYPWYDFILHLYVLEQFLKSPEYGKLDPAIRAQFVIFWTNLKSAQADAMVHEQLRQLEVKTAVAAGELHARSELAPLAARANPAPPDGGTGTTDPTNPASAPGANASPAAA